MRAPGRSLPAATPTREETARLEVGHTTVSPGLARALAVCFLVAIGSVPSVEWFGLYVAPAGDRATAWSHLIQLPGEVRSHLRGETLSADAGAWRRLVSANRRVLAGLSGFEHALDDASLIGRTLRRPAQALMAGVLGAGNERVYPGRAGWLFYRPDVEYVTGHPFLEPAQLRRRAAAAAEWDAPPQPDPRPAIIGFKQDLEARGITLVVVPTPVKPGVHPEALSRRYAGGEGVVHNAAYAELVEDLEQAGVLVFEPSEVLGGGSLADPEYLMTDTHWRPEAMELVAERLGAFITARVSLPDAEDPGYRLERADVRNLGDTARMLDLPDGSPLFPAETVWLRRVLLPDGSVWRSSRGADVLLLGDSFSNIYALESMGWGTSAGLAEQLSYALGRPLDRLVQNDDGAFATRAMLPRDPARLAGTRVVVYQFAARELAFGDWRLIEVGP